MSKSTHFKRKYAKGIKVIDVSANEMAKILISVSPLAEQERIVSILDKFDTLILLSVKVFLRRSNYVKSNTNAIGICYSHFPKMMYTTFTFVG